MEIQEGNYRIKLDLTGTPGGVFSQFIFLLSRVPCSVPVNNIYFEAPSVGESNSYWDGRMQTPNTYKEVSDKDNPFDWVFDQHYDDSYDLVYVYVGAGISLRIQDSPHYPNWKQHVKLIKIQDHLAKKIDAFALENITENTLGVHLRTSDMNMIHPHHGVFTTDDYITAIRKIVKENDIRNIFVACDNKKSIKRMEEEFDNVVYYNCTLRKDDDIGWGGPLSINQAQLNNPVLWEEAFIDCMLLSKCSSLVRRISGMANAAIIFSDTIGKEYKLGEI